MATQIITSTPILGALRDKGATFYTFSSALNDLDKCMLNNSTRMQPSKFVCCKLPNWQNVTDKSIQSIYVNGADLGSSAITNPNVLWPKVIQNYCENLIQYCNANKVEEGLTQDHSTPAELAWWKLLQKLGVIQLDNVLDEFGDPLEVNPNTQYRTVFAEPVESTNYHQVVQYIGDINVMNNVEKHGQNYTEVMMYIPTKGGRITKNQFIQGEFESAESIIPAEPGPENSIGLTYDEDPLSKALYDTDSNNYDLSSQKSLTGVWFDSSSNEYTFEEFEFNTILVYYDIWSVDPVTGLSIPSTKCTNLMGVLFLSNLTSTQGSGTGMWENYTKLVENSSNSGNSYLFRLALKTVNATSQVSAEVLINDDNMVSMALYKEAIEKLNHVSELYENALGGILKKVESYDKYISLVTQYPNLESIGRRLTQLERLVGTGANMNQISTSEILELMQTLNQTIAANPSAVISINKITGNPFVNAAGNMVVVSPDGVTWVWDKSINQFVTDENYSPDQSETSEGSTWDASNCLDLACTRVLTGDLKSEGTITAKAFYETSDKRVKENLHPIPQNLIELVYKLQTVGFNFIGNPTERFGYLAQDVEKISPSFVFENVDGIKGINYTELHTVEIAALKERIKQLENAIK